MSKIIIGLAGEMACGKGTAAKHIKEKYQASSYRFSTMLRDVANRLYVEQTRENVATLSTILRQNFGEDLFAKVMAEDVKKDENKVIVIDGIRRLADIEYLKKIPEFKFVYIEADIHNCYDRIIKRGENTDDNNKTFEKFMEEHNLETELQIKDLKNYADFVIDNDADFNHLHEQVDKIIESCKN
ncbi:MAG: AAA family ATPase [Parcubacteria group bacterium]|jgi:dephospho-CoA kinase